MSGELVEVFISYAHADDELRKKFVSHLSDMQGRIISAWNDREIPGGAEWEATIDDRLNSADLILLLISSDFMASRYCREIEIPRALERHEAGEARVIPIILRPVNWASNPLNILQAYPTDAKPVQSRDWHSEDEAFVNVVAGVEAVATELLEFSN